MLAGSVRSGHLAEHLADLSHTHIRRRLGRRMAAPAGESCPLAAREDGWADQFRMISRGEARVRKIIGAACCAAGLCARGTGADLLHSAGVMLVGMGVLSQ